MSNRSKGLILLLALLFLLLTGCQSISFSSKSPTGSSDSGAISGSNVIVRSDVSGPEAPAASSNPTGFSCSCGTVHSNESAPETPAAPAPQPYVPLSEEEIGILSSISSTSFSEEAKELVLAPLLRSFLICKSWESADRLTADDLANTYYAMNYVHIPDPSVVKQYFSEDQADELNCTVSIPQAEVENTVGQYFPIDTATLRSSRAYNPEKQTYDYNISGVGGAALRWELDGVERSADTLKVFCNVYELDSDLYTCMVVTVQLYEDHFQYISCTVREE